MKWTEKEVEICKSLLLDGKNFKEIGCIIGKSHDSVSKKMNRLGIKGKEINYKHPHHSREYITKYESYNWDNIQKIYDSGVSYEKLISDYGLSSHAIIWAKENNKIKMRTLSEGVKMAYKQGKYKPSLQTGVKRYRQLCEFKFKLRDYPDRFDFSLIEKYGWYKAKNRGDNPNGVSRDHMYSVKEGFINNIDPYIISHPANCQLLNHLSNNKKNTTSSLTLEELLSRIEKW